MPASFPASALAARWCGSHSGSFGPPADSICGTRPHLCNEREASVSTVSRKATHRKAQSALSATIAGFAWVSHTRKCAVRLVFW